MCPSLDYGPGVFALLKNAAADSDLPALSQLGELVSDEVADDLDEAIRLLPLKQVAASREFDHAGVGHGLDHPGGHAGRENVAEFSMGYKGGNVNAGDLIPEIPGTVEDIKEPGIVSDGQTEAIGPAQVVGDESSWIAECLWGVFEMGVGGVVGMPRERLGGSGGSVAACNIGADILEEQLTDRDVAAAEEVHGDGPTETVSQYERILNAELFDELRGISREVVQIVRGGAGTVTMASMVGSEDVAVREEGFDEPGMVNSHGGGAVQDEHVRARVSPFQVMKTDVIEGDVALAVAPDIAGHRVSRVN